MQPRKFIFASILFSFFIASLAHAQVSISSNNTPPDTSAMLDIQSNTKGILIPRMTRVQREAIFSPAEGLLVYDTDTRSFWFRQSGQWTELVSGQSGLHDQDDDTRITVEDAPDEDTIRMVAGGREVLKTGGKALKVGSEGNSVYIGKHAGESTPEERQGNVFIGDAAGQNNTGSFSTGVGDSVLFMSGNTGRMTAFGYTAGMQSTDSLSTYIGYQAGKHATGNRSVHIGYEAGANDQGTSNIVIGAFAGNDTLTGGANVFVGKSAGSANQSGNSNTFIGESAGAKNIDGDLNTFIGRVAGHRNQKGERNTFIGAFSGGNPGVDSLGNSNTFVGVASGSYLTSGKRNVFVGDGAGFRASTASRNTALGTSAGSDLTTGERNVFLGDGTGGNTTTGHRNTFIGEGAGLNNVIGNDNTYLGRSAGENATGSKNVFLGSYAGFNELDSNKLYIANDSTGSPLIYGDFAEQFLQVNGNANVTDSLAVGVTHQKAKFHVKDDGVSGQRTIVGVLESNTSDRPTLLFSEFPDSSIDNGMSIEYNGEGSFDNGRMHINKPGGDAIITFQNTGHVGIGVNEAAAPLHIAGNFIATSVPGPVDPPPVSGAGNRMMWYGDKVAFRAGGLLGSNPNNWDQDSIGYYSFAGGLNTKAIGNSSFAFGSGTTASGSNSVAFGSNSIAKGGASIALGSNTHAGGAISIAIGNSTTASGINSTAIGNSTTANAQNATAMGLLTAASGVESTAIGSGTRATNYATTSMGFNTEASGFQSTALGNQTKASGSNSIAIGFRTNAKGTFSSSIGNTTIANGFSSTVIGMFNDTILSSQSSIDPLTPLFIVGNGDSTAQRSNAMMVRKDGNVGIGTNEPQARLHIKGDDNNGLISTIRVSNGSNSLLMDGNEIDAIDTDLFLQSNTTDDVILSNGGGNVGIGTSAPLSKLTVAGQIQSTTGGMKFPDGSIQTAASTKLGWNLGGNAGTTTSEFIGTTDSHNLNFRTNNQQRMTIDAGGNIGIGTTAPEHPLHIDKAGTSGQPTITMVLASNTSKRPVLLFSENPSSIGLEDGMSLEYDGAISGNKFYINGINGIPRFTVENLGEVGIGTTNPNRELTVFDTDDDGDAVINLKASNSSEREMLLAVNQGSGGIVGMVTNNDLLFRTNNANRMVIENNGEVGIGTTSPTALLEVNGTVAKKIGGGVWTATSDLRLKQNIRDYQEGLSEVLEIRPVKYQYNEKSGHETSVVHIGVIAQELKKIAPHMVSAYEKDGEEYLQVDNSAMTYMLINAVKEQQKMLDQYQQEVKLLREEIQGLQNSIMDPLYPKQAQN